MSGMIEPGQLAFLPFKDKQALLDWALSHGDMHRQVAQHSVELGHLNLGTTQLYDMEGFEEWLYIHNQEHEEIAETYNLQTPPDLSWWDFDDEVNFSNWAQAHALTHEYELKALGLL